MSSDLLALVLDDLLPGGEGFPAGSAIGLAGWLRGRADFAAPAQAVLDLLPLGFAAASSAERAAALRDLEHLAAFDRLLVGAYSGYYVHPDVIAVIAERTGYPARPPQPEGYDLPPFDPTLLDAVRLRSHGYREA
jgi:hypothetical protein